MKGPDGSQVRYNPKDAPGNAQYVSISDLECLLMIRVRDTDGNTHSAGGLYNKAQEKKEEARQQKEENKGEAKEQLKSHAQDVASNRNPNASASEQAQQMRGAAESKRDEASNRASNDSRTPNSTGEAKDQARDKANQLKEKIPEEHRQRIADTIDTQKQIVQDAFPEERREQFIYRLKKVSV